MRSRSVRQVSVRVAVLSAVVVVLAALGAVRAAPAAADITSVFAGHTVSGQAVSCSTQSDGTRVCQGDIPSGAGADTRLASFDGSPLAFYVTLPAVPASGRDGHYPIIIQSHGYGVIPSGPDDTQYYGPTARAWAKDGYAVLQLVARGFGDSCGTPTSRLVDPSGCANGYIRLDDARYEARDAQNAVGLLVDEGVADPGRIGATGESYGGGISLELATLKNRIMNVDGTLAPWTSPAGAPLSIAAAAPVIPWSDLVYSLVPNGRTLDYQVTGPKSDLSPIGVEKQSFVSGLFALGQKSGYYAPAGTNDQADLTTWYGSLNAGEPYDTNSEDQSIVAQIAQYHSPYYLLDGAYGVPAQAPSPLLVANGFTDDLFPVDEALRYSNLEHSLYPGDPFSLFAWDGGHQRGQNKAADGALLSGRIQGFLDHYVKSSGAADPGDVTALTQTCPAGAPAGGPFMASSWAALHPGEVDYASSSGQTIQSSAGNPSTSQTVDPIAGGGACATAPAADDGPGVATYRLPAATGSGYTLLGSPTVIANLSVTGSYPLIAARLWDVDPSSNTETLVARGVYRLDPNAPNGVQVFQLHPGAWHFAAGHIPKLELLGKDAPYIRSSNGQFSIAVSDLQLRLAVHETPGAAGTPGAVGRPLPAFVPSSSSPGAPRSSCRGIPSSRIAKRRARAARHGFTVSGTASPSACRRGATAARGNSSRVRRVYVTVYRPLAHGRCRYLVPGGGLAPASRCGVTRVRGRSVRFLAAGTTRWHLSRRLSIPPGGYLIRSEAVDASGRSQRRSGASAVRVSVRSARAARAPTTGLG